MGLMLGKIDKDCIIIQSSWALPVEGTETRVNAHSQAYEYMSKYMDDIKAVERLEPVVGWYHSHPGYGCWLSGIDVTTQRLHQQYEDPFVAIVVDPIRTMSSKRFKNISSNILTQLIPTTGRQRYGIPVPRTASQGCGNTVPNTVL